MKVLFCHDGPISKDNHGNYYGIAHNDDMFRRYYNIADEINVLIRIREVSKENIESKLSKITVTPFNVIQCDNISSLNGLIKNYKNNRKVIKKEVKKNDYIVVRLPSTIGFIAMEYAKKYNIPCLVELVTCPWDAFWNHSIKGKLVAPYMYYKTKKMVKSANYVVYVTNDFLQRRYPTKGKSVNCSNVSLKEFDNKVLKKRVEKIKNLNYEDKIILGTTAAVNIRFKGQQYIIKALGKLKKEGITNFEYQLVGSGSQEYLKKIAKQYDVAEQVKFMGVMPHNDVFEWLDNIDIYVQPSRQEGLPRALIEAMSKGVPAFGAKTAGIPELLDSQFIFSNSKNNVNEICEILKKIDKDTMIYQANRNFNEAKKYDKKIIEERRKKFFEEYRIHHL